MGNQRTFASLAWNGKGRVTRRERFLAEMDAVIPWPRLVRRSQRPFLTLFIFERGASRVFSGNW
jgi:IS5 family transposase